jgi:hypothetical protein
VVKGKAISTQPGFDCCLARDRCFAAAENRGLGQRKYYVVGYDRVTDSPLASIKGHLGAVRGGEFSDVITGALYFDVYKLPWDLQKTAFSYFDAVDQLTGSKLKKEFLDTFDEDADGIVTYEEFGKKGIWGSLLALAGEYISRIGMEPLGYLKGLFLYQASLARLRNPRLNPPGHDLFKELFYGSTCVAALRMSQAEVESPDPFLPGLTFGKGKWPSFQLASHVLAAAGLYGPEFPNKLGYPSLYGTALFYADLSQTGGQYAGKIRNAPDPDGVARYVSEVTSGTARPLDFILYVPPGFETAGGVAVPNVEATTEPAEVYTASFGGGKEVWNRIAA